MKKIVMILGLMVFFTFNGISQNATQPSSARGQAKNKNMQATSNKNAWKQDKVNEFVKEAAYGSMMEVLLGNMAKEKASSAQVKDFGNTMVKNHSDASHKLKSAVKNSVAIPATLDQKHQDKIDKIKDKTGKAFDKEYMDLMVKDHKKDVSDFEEAQKNVTDPALKGWIDNTLPVLRQHLSRAQGIQSQL